MPATALPMQDRIPLKRRVLAASAWSLAGYGVSLGIRFGSNLVMTRLLVPEMFGVMAIATIVMVGLAMFSDLGLRQSIVQSRRGADPAFLNTAWALQILRGLALWLIALAIALGVYLADHAGMVPATSVYADPSLPWVIAALSFGTVIGGFTTTKAAEASRNLALGRLTQIELAAQVAGLCAMLAWAWFDRSIWALVAGGLTSAAVSAAAGHAWLPGTPNRWQWDRSALMELVHFGKWIFASSILGFLVANSDRLLLGAMVDATTLGVYVIAFLMFSAIEQVVGRLIRRCVLSRPQRGCPQRRRPASGLLPFSRRHRGDRIFLRGLPDGVGPGAGGVLYDHRYAQAGWMLQILAAALLTAPFQIAIQAYLALGMPQLHSRILVSPPDCALSRAMPFGFLFFRPSGGALGSCGEPIFVSTDPHRSTMCNRECLPLKRNC